MTFLFEQIKAFLVKMLVKAMPDSTGLPAGVESGFDFFISKIYSLSFIFPANVLMDVLTFTVLFEIGFFLVWLTLFIIKLVRGS